MLILDGSADPSTCSDDFLDFKVDDLPLTIENRYEIYYVAINHYLAGKALLPYPSILPPATNLIVAKQWFGPEAALMLGFDINEIFTGINLSVFKQLVALFCSHLNLSVRIIHEIIINTVSSMNLNPNSYIGIWAVCNYLLDLRNRKNAVSLILDQPDWQVNVTRVPIKLLENDTIFPLMLATIIDTDEDRVISFRVSSPQNISKAIQLAVYDAVVIRRQPSIDAEHGVLWRLPKRIRADADLQTICSNICNDWGVEIIEHDSQSETINLIRTDWTKDLSLRKVTEVQANRIINNYLFNFCGGSPKKLRAQLKKKHSQLTGYKNDPAILFPQLRNLLPIKGAVISESGEIRYSSYHYRNSHLNLWAGRPVRIRCSEHTDARIWVYLGDEIIGEAMAAELMRSNGSYRLIKSEG